MRKTVLINSFPTLHEAVLSYGKMIVAYRGVRDESYLLIPKIGRVDFLNKGRTLEYEEEVILKRFRTHALPYLRVPCSNSWDWLALAQHHGLPTRLLDWTLNPLVAAYFAVAEDHSGDSAVYAYTFGQSIDLEVNPDPFHLDVVGLFRPSHITERITAQAALFTIHPKPRESFDSDKIDKYVITNAFRRELKFILYRYGVTRASMFPGLDGLAGHIEWLRADQY